MKLTPEPLVEVLLQPAPKRILIVDDHPLVRQGLAENIGTEPDLCVCGEAGDGFAALELARALKPDLAIVDLMIPRKNGLELIKDLHAEVPQVGVLVFSMHDELVYAERVLRAGGRGYVMKREDSDRLLAAVRQVLAGEIAVSAPVMQKLFAHCGGGKAADSPLDRLSDRELEVFEMIGFGWSNAVIGDQLHISRKTVEAHRKRVREKLGLESTARLVAEAARWEGR